MSMLDQMRKRVKDRQPTFEKDYSVFAFWNMKYGASSTLRFAPYNDPYTGAFFAAKIMLPMVFDDPNDDAVVIKYQAPCVEMYDHTQRCRVLNLVRELYAEEKELRNSGQTAEADALKKIAGFHWKKPVYYYQGFVIKPGFTEEETPENPIRVFPLNKKLHQKIYDSVFEDNEEPFEKLPTGEYTEEDVALLLDGKEVNLDKFTGYNFLMKKVQQGEYADWASQSNWLRSKVETLDEEQIAAIAQYGLWDLTKRLPDRPSDEQYDVLVEMMEVSIRRQVSNEGGNWRKEWEEAGFKPFRPRSSSNSNNSDSSAGSSDSQSTTTTSGARTTSASTNAAKASSGGSGALDRLRAQRGKKAAGASAEDTETAKDESPAEVAAAATEVVEAVEAPAAETTTADAPAEDTSNLDLKARVAAKIASKKSA